MLKKELEESYIRILQRELVPALGCTEPIALAYAAAKACKILGQFPEKMIVYCSGNVIKNVKAVTVPNSGGMRGVDAACVLGAVGGNADRELEVLEDITEEDIKKTRELLKTDFIECRLQKDVENLYIVAEVYAKNHSAKVKIVNRHTLITEIVKDEKVIYQIDMAAENSKEDYSKLTIRDILEFANTVETDKLKDLLNRQIEMNQAVSNEGMKNPYGAEVGRTLMEKADSSVRTRACAYAAAGSDARMGGCSLPVVINSGSGNQGMTVSLPVIVYAEYLGKSREELYRALIVSNLVAIHQKHYIGSLSAFCGAVIAASGAGAAITYMMEGSYEAVSRTIVNTVANVGGIVCDGAKASCAAKIASAVDAAILAHSLSMKGRTFHEGEGIIQDTVEETIQSVGYVGRVGMKETDHQILKIMLNQVQFEK